MKTTKNFQIESFGRKRNVHFVINTYNSNGNMCVRLVEDTGEPYDYVSTNLDTVPAGCAFVDTNRSPEMVDILEKYGFAKYCDITRDSGYCTYPLYEFDLDAMADYISPESDYFLI